MKKNIKKQDDKWQMAEKVTKDFLGQVKNLKAKYDNMDPKTKKKLLAGVAGATALIAGAVIVKKMKKKKV